jgi:hypothetical protein
MQSTIKPKKPPVTKLSEDTPKKPKIKNRIGGFLTNIKKSTSEDILAEPTNPIFGKTLEDALLQQPSSPVGHTTKNRTPGIPAIIEDCITAVDTRGLRSEGIYRLSGQAALIQKIKASYQANDPLDLLDDEMDINAVAGVLKCTSFL